MEDFLRPFIGLLPQFQLRRAPGEFDLENAALRRDFGHVLEQHLEPLVAAKKEMIGFQIGFSSQGPLLVADLALDFLSHNHASIATGSPNLTPKSRRYVSMLPV